MPLIAPNWNIRDDEWAVVQRDGFVALQRNLCGRSPLFRVVILVRNSAEKCESSFGAPPALAAVATANSLADAQKDYMLVRAVVDKKYVRKNAGSLTEVFIVLWTKEHPKQRTVSVAEWRRVWAARADTVATDLQDEKLQDFLYAELDSTDRDVLIFDEYGNRVKHVVDYCDEFGYPKEGVYKKKSREIMLVKRDSAKNREAWRKSMMVHQKGGERHEINYRLDLPQPKLLPGQQGCLVNGRYAPDAFGDDLNVAIPEPLPLFTSNASSFPEKVSAMPAMPIGRSNSANPSSRLHGRLFGSPTPE